MLSEDEKKIMEFMSKQMLVTKSELLVHLEKENYNGTDVSLQRLREMGYIDKVESMGNCLVITQKGLKAMREVAVC